MPDNKVEIIISAKDMASGVFRDVQKDMQTLAKKTVSQVDAIKSRVLGLQGALVGLAGGYGLKRLAESSLDVASSFEQMEIKLDVMTRGKGPETLDRINQWALDMPVNTREAVDTFTLMQAMGLDPTIEKMEVLVDVSSIFGDDAMPRVARALGQMQTLGKLSAEELNQLAEAGINARKYLTEAFGMTVEELQRSKVSIDQIVDAIWRGLDAEYSGAAKKAQNTWRGMVTTFKSYFEELQREVMAAGVFDELKDQLGSINAEMASWIQTNETLIQQKVPEYIAQAKAALQGVWDVISYDPAIIEYGLIGLALGGKKGAFLAGGMAHLTTWAETFGKAMGLVASGHLEFSQVAQANFKELQALVNQFDTDPVRSEMAQTVAELENQVQAMQEKVYGGDPAELIPFTAVTEDAEKELAALEAKLAEARARLRNYAESSELQAVMEAQTRIMEEAVRTTTTTDTSDTTTNSTRNEFINLQQSLHVESEKIEKEHRAFLTELRQASHEKDLLLLQEAMDAETRAIEEGLAQQAAAREAAEADMSTIRQQALAKELELLDQAMREETRYIEEALEGTKDKSEDLFADMDQAMQGWAASWSGSLNDMLWGADMTFSDILESFAKMITQMLLQKAVIEPLFEEGSGLLGGLFDVIGGLFSGGSAQGNVFDQGEMVPFGKGGAFETRNAERGTRIVPYANGGAFETRNSKLGTRIVPYAMGGIVDRPTLFPMATGVGLMGEAGPEAILPLTRMPDGDLGVRAQSAERMAHGDPTDLADPTDRKARATTQSESYIREVFESVNRLVEETEKENIERSTSNIEFLMNTVEASEATQIQHLISSIQHSAPLTPNASGLAPLFDMPEVPAMAEETRRILETVNRESQGAERMAHSEFFVREVFEGINRTVQASEATHIQDLVSSIYQPTAHIESLTNTVSRETLGAMPYALSEKTRTTDHGQPVTIHLTINALDARSVVELMEQNPEAVVGPLSNELQAGNRTLTRLLKVATV